MDLCQAQQQVVRVGPFCYGTAYNAPRTGLHLYDFAYRSLIKPIPTSAVVDLNGHQWSDLPGLSGWYNLVLTVDDTSATGTLTGYFHIIGTHEAIIRYWNVLSASEFNAKYGGQAVLTNTEPWIC